MERIVVPFEIKQFNEDDNGFFTFEGFASTFGNIDHGGDVIEKGAFLKTLKKKEQDGEKVPALWQHKTSEPIGVYTSLIEQKEGLFVKGRLPKEDTFVSGRVVPQLKVGSVRKMSIGFSTFGDSGLTETIDGIRHVKDLELFEISLVTFSMNDKATITEVKKLLEGIEEQSLADELIEIIKNRKTEDAETKSVVPFQDLPLADRSRPWDASAAKQRVREWAGAEDGLDTPAIQRKYSRCFLWYDRSKPELFESYKLPITDIIDGHPTAVPRGIFAAAAAMQGARGGVDIPDADRAGVINHLERYYSKMGLESPFKEERSFRIDDFSTVDDRTLERILKSGVCFNNQTSKVVISAIKALGDRDDNPEGNRDGEHDWTELTNKINETKKLLEEDNA